MALKVSPQRLREVRFGEQWRGYRTDEVDEFVERVAEAFDALDEQVRQAIDRAARAELALQERGPEDHVSRTLVLAQRTADAAVQEAEAEAARLVDEARRRAHELVSEAERRVACQQAEMEARAAAELHDLVERRRALESDVTLLAGYVLGRRAADAAALARGRRPPAAPTGGRSVDSAPRGCFARRGDAGSDCLAVPGTEPVVAGQHGDLGRGRAGGVGHAGGGVAAGCCLTAAGRDHERHGITAHRGRRRFR